MWQEVAAAAPKRLQNVPRNAGRLLVRLYRFTFSPLVGFHCRHVPTCSEYADEALTRHGLWAGCWMTLGRLCRCQPFGTSGLDFVPEALPPRARWYMPWRYARWRGTNSPRFPAAPDAAGPGVVN
jgi:uncharacterized protein